MMATPALHGFVHRFVPASGTNRTPLLLLHGTGGDETALLPLGEALAPEAALLSPRGKASESGMPRFFDRLAEGRFDLDEVRRRALDLADFIGAARRAYALDAPVAVGYSNGANVAAAVMILRPGVVSGAVLLRPMAILDEPAGRLDSTRVLMLSGVQDPIVPAARAETLAAQLHRGGAAVDHRVLPAGHGMTRADLDIARAWIGRYDRP